MKKALIEFKDFSFRYKTQNEFTLKDINLTIYEGEKVLLLGPSGCGKSTLSNCINGLIPFSYPGEIKGSCKVAGMETSSASLFRLSGSVGTVLQDSDAQFVGLSVGEDIAYALENDNMPRPQMLPMVQSAANIVGMGDFLEASKTFFQLIKRNPDYYKAYLGIAMSFDKLEKYGDAIRYYKKFLNLKQFSEDALFARQRIGELKEFTPKRENKFTVV